MKSNNGTGRPVDAATTIHSEKTPYQGTAAWNDLQDLLSQLLLNIPPTSVGILPLNAITRLSMIWLASTQGRQVNLTYPGRTFSGYLERCDRGGIGYHRSHHFCLALRVLSRERRLI